MKFFPPRIHILLARDAALGVVIRRGPSKQVCTLLWDRRDDNFRMGQWLKGRIYERRSDLTPDGKHLIYFAMNGHWKSEAKGSWTAISRAPYLKAISLFPKGDCWHGGGMFTGKRTYWLNDGCGHFEQNISSEVERDANFQPDQHFGGECPSVYYPRLMRDGWTLIERLKEGKWQSFDVFEKLFGREWTLRKIAHSKVGAPPGKGCYWDEHELLHTSSGTVITRADWEWAEVDGNRLVWASKGKLYAGKTRGREFAVDSELYDFNPMKFEPIEAPY